MPPLGLYVHIPFCARKCAYCDFASWAGRQADMPRYVDALCAEIEKRAGECGHPAADTVFFGGGTPSLLPPESYMKIARMLRNCFSIAPDAEWTVECNPGTLTADFADVLRESGCNRLSMGLQAAQPRLLNALGRIHTLFQAREAAGIARRAGIRRLNLDLMLGLPGQTLADMDETLKEALRMEPEHLSCYALILEEGTPLYDRVNRGEVSLPGDDADREMYGLCRETLQRHGFRQYEISNFALPGQECRHNVNCWRREDYLGFGCAAHSLWKNERRANPRGIDAYLSGEAPETERIDSQEAMFETMMLGLRLTRGVEEADFARRYGRELWTVYGARLQPAADDGRLKRENGYVFLTERGMDVMNSVLVALLD
ncbi:MAG: radical SAM family heme chaperone HemW [Clostridia bacterium]|nr:radical SAM family heme chaperone HemW [Clostridia bacterium]